MDKQQQHYTFKQMMERLGLKSINAFRQLERKYPDVFANISPYRYKDKNPWYDKAAIENFAQTRENPIKSELNTSAKRLIISGADMTEQKEYYLIKQMMERLGLKSINAFRQLERKYPDVFANINPSKDKKHKHWYDKAAIDEFAKRREQIHNWKVLR